MTSNTKWLIIIGLIVVVVVAIILCIVFIPQGNMGFNSKARACGSCASKSSNGSQFPLTKSGVLTSSSGPYVASSNVMSPSKSNFTYISPSTQSLASMVQPVEDVQLGSSEGYTASLSDPTDLLPDVSSTYNVDVSNPDVYCFRPSGLRNLKNRQFEAADAFRGDIPISVDDSNVGWFRSQYANRGSLKTEAYFKSNCMNKSRVEDEGTIVESSPNYEIIS